MRIRVALLTLALLLAASARGRADEAPAGDAKPSPAQEQIDQALFDDHADTINMLLQDGSAEDFYEYANGLKNDGKFDKAAIFFLVALKMKPDYVRAQYQLACDFALWGQEKLALNHLKAAVKLGLWNYPELKDDGDLQALHENPDFQAIVADVKARYDVEAPKHVGGSTLKVPEGAAPKGGWPIMVMLHGWGSNKEDFSEVAGFAATHGCAALAVSGPIVMNEQGYSWPAEHIEETHAYLQQILAGYHGDKKLDFNRVYLMGFSQGALQAADLLMTQPQSYRGALVVSPGGAPEPPEKLVEPSQPRKLFLVYGTQEQDRNKQLVAMLEQRWKEAKLPVHVGTHDGAHEFPADWETRFVAAFTWLGAQ